MPFGVADLLLTDERLAQFTAALENVGIADPLVVVIQEAQAEVDRWTLGYLLDDASKAPWIRVLALHKAYLAAELGVPEDIQTAVDAAIAELTAIAAGKRPNLPLAPADPDAPDQPTAAGDWGSETKISTR